MSSPTVVVRYHVHCAADPLFTDFTWGAGGSTADLTMAITMEAKRRGLLPNMHLTCTNMEKETVHEALRKAKEAGIRNILALRGGEPVRVTSSLVASSLRPTAVV